MPDDKHVKYTLTEEQLPRAGYNIVPDLLRPLPLVLHPDAKQPVSSSPI